MPPTWWQEEEKERTKGVRSKIGKVLKGSCNFGRVAESIGEDGCKKECKRGV